MLFNIHCIDLLILPAGSWYRCCQQLRMYRQRIRNCKVCGM